MAKRKRYTHSDAYLTKKYFKRVRKEYGDDIVNMIAADWAAEIAQTKKAQLIERAAAAKAWQAKNPGKKLPKQFTQRMKYTNLPSVREYDPEYYYYIKQVMKDQAVSKDVAEAVYDEMPDDTPLDDAKKFKDAAEKVLEGRRTEFYNQATGEGREDRFKSNRQKEYQEIVDLAEKLALTDYRDLAEAAAEGRYAEALAFNKDYLEKKIAEANEIIDGLQEMQKKREEAMHDPNADKVALMSDYNRDAKLIAETKDKINEMYDLLNYQIQGIKREELRRMRRQLGVD